MFRIWSRSFNLYGYDAQGKNNVFFPQLALFSNNLVLTSYLSGIYLESWFSWLWGGVQKTSKKRRKHIEERHWKVIEKNKEYEESQITTIYIFGFILYFAGKYNLKKKSFIPSNFIYSFLQDIWDTVMIHQIWISINIPITL